MTKPRGVQRSAHPMPARLHYPEHRSSHHLGAERACGVAGLDLGDNVPPKLVPALNPPQPCAGWGLISAVREQQSILVWREQGTHAAGG
ncbi:MAG: hypothetical protein ACRDF6_11400 [bacterium]